MTEWYYRATESKVTFSETCRLAKEEGFLCRSAFEANGTHADNTQKLGLGDLIHFYYSHSGAGYTVIGTFKVVAPHKHPHPELFGKAVTGTALYEVAEEFEKKLVALGTGEGEGYEPDPHLKKVTGWFLIPREDITTPPFAEAPFRGQSSLVTKR